MTPDGLWQGEDRGAPKLEHVSKMYPFQVECAIADRQTDPTSYHECPEEERMNDADKVDGSRGH